MNKNIVLLFLKEYGIFFIQFFLVIFGVVAQECYQILRTEDYKFKNVIPKLVVAWFVCILATPFIKESEYLNNKYPYVILLLAASWRPAADWVFKSLVPTLGNVIIKLISKKVE